MFSNSPPRSQSQDEVMHVFCFGTIQSAGQIPPGFSPTARHSLPLQRWEQQSTRQERSQLTLALHCMTVGAKGRINIFLASVSVDLAANKELMLRVRRCHFYTVVFSHLQGYSTKVPATSCTCFTTSNARAARNHGFQRTAQQLLQRQSDSYYPGSTAHTDHFL